MQKALRASEKDIRKQVLIGSKVNNPGQNSTQKVHSGVVVHSEGRMVRIEGIDLKVW